MHLYDVFAVNIKTQKVRMMERGVTKNNAEAYITLAVVRRGVEKEFFAEAPAGTYDDGDIWGKDKAMEGAKL